MKKYELYRLEREKGLSYREIASKYGVSMQNIAQACAKSNPCHFRFWTDEQCIYPNVRNWLNENKISIGLKSGVTITIFDFLWSIIRALTKRSIYGSKKLRRKRKFSY